MGNFVVIFSAHKYDGNLVHTSPEEKIYAGGYIIFYFVHEYELLFSNQYMKHEELFYYRSCPPPKKNAIVFK